LGGIVCLMGMTTLDQKLKSMLCFKDMQQKLRSRASAFSASAFIEFRAWQHRPHPRRQHSQHRHSVN
jgi:hypothetical protein